MLHKVAKDRLDKVLEILEKSNIRFHNAEIVRRTGINKSIVSDYLNGVKPISDNFYRTFLEKFPDTDNIKNNDGEKIEDIVKKIGTQTITERTIADLARSAILLAEANRDLSENNTRLTVMLEANLSSSQHISDTLKPYLHQLAEGLAAKLDMDDSKLLEMMGSILTGNLLKKTVSGKHAVVSK